MLVINSKTLAGPPRTGMYICGIVLGSFMAGAILTCLLGHECEGFCYSDRAYMVQH